MVKIPAVQKLRIEIFTNLSALFSYILFYEIVWVRAHRQTEVLRTTRHII